MDLCKIYSRHFPGNGEVLEQITIKTLRTKWHKTCNFHVGCFLNVLSGTF